MPKPPEDLDDILADLAEFQAGNDSDDLEAAGDELASDDIVSDISETSKTNAVNDLIAEEMSISKPKITSKPLAQLVKNTEVIVQTDPLLEISEMLQKIKNEFDTIKGRVLESWESDRAQTQTVIDILFNDLQSMGAQTPRVYIEGLVKLLEVKSNSNITPVKLLDAQTRLLQAIKGGAGVVINNSASAAAGASTNGELTKLLSEPAVSDFSDD